MVEVREKRKRKKTEHYHICKHGTHKIVIRKRWRDQYNYEGNICNLGRKGSNCTVLDTHNAKETNQLPVCLSNNDLDRVDQYISVGNEKYAYDQKWNIDSSEMDDDLARRRIRNYSIKFLGYMGRRVIKRPDFRNPVKEFNK